MDLRILFKAYLDKYPTLGFKSESQAIIHFLREKALNIIKENPDLKEIKEIQLTSGKYVLDEDGSYKRV